MGRLKMLTRDEAAQVFADQERKNKMDAATRMLVAEERGLERGRLERDKEVVCNMLKKKLDISFISEVTGLPEAEIIKLQSAD